MDLGATLCTRAKPDCQRCPFEQDCQAHQLARETEFPVNPKRALKPTKQVYMLLCQDQISRKILLEKRPPTGIWGGLWSLPQCDIDIDVSTWCVQTFNLTVQNIKVLDEVLHHFSHFSLKIKPLLLEVNLKKQQVMDSTRLIWYNKTAEFPGGISAPVKKILKGQEYYV